MTRLALLERLKEVQQMPRYQGRDITTISAVLSNQALATIWNSARKLQALRRDSQDKPVARRSRRTLAVREVIRRAFRSGCSTYGHLLGGSHA